MWPGQTDYLTSGVISSTLPSTLGFRLQEESSRSSTLGLASLPLTGDLDFPISDIGECDREGEILLTGKRPSSVSCFTTLDLGVIELITDIWPGQLRIMIFSEGWRSTNIISYLEK